MTATFPLTLIPLYEDVSRARAPLKVDREAGIIHRVKVLGWESANRRRYQPEAAKKAVGLGLYEGAKVYWDHPKNRQEPRDSNDAVGVLRRTTWEPDGVYADLHYFKADARALKLCEDCERGLAFYGLSHNADGQGERNAEGVLVITEIVSVYSVDVVTDSATVANLWEGRAPIKQVTVASIFEALTTNAKLDKGIRRRLLEMDDVPASATMNEPAAEMSPEDQLSAGFEAAIIAIVKGEGVAVEKAKKIADYLKTHEKLLGKGGAEEVAEESDDAEAEDGDEKKESKKVKTPASGAQVLTEERAKSLCRIAGVTPDAELLETLVGSDESKGLKLIEWAKGRTAGTTAKGPRSSPAGTLTPPAKTVPVVEGKAPEERRKTNLEFLRSGRN